MGIGCRIDDDPIYSSVRLLNFIYDGTFVVALEHFGGKAFFPTPINDLLYQLRVGGMSVNLRLPNAKHIQVRSIDYQ